MKAEGLLLSFLNTGVKIYDLFGGGSFFPRSMNEYYRWSKLERNHLRSQLQRLKKQQLVETFKKNKETWAKLTKKGERRVIEILFKKNKIPAPKKWDRRWRIVIFDVPEKLRAGRDALRDKLNNLGFHKIQKSVFVHPFACYKEIDMLRRIYEIKPYVLYLETKKIENERKLLEIFIEQGILTKDLI